jgi:UPF0755 protein
MAKKRSLGRTLGTLAIGLVVLAGLGLALAWKPIKAIYLSGVPPHLRQSYLYIPTGATFDQVVDSLVRNGFISDEASFVWVAEQMKYKRTEMRAGRYRIEPGLNNRQLVQHLRAGKQEPLKVVLNNERLLEEVAGKVGGVIEADSLELIHAFLDPAFLAEVGYTPENLMAIFIPNTYEFFWNTDAKGFVKRMLKEHEAFWSKNDRRAKAQSLGLTPTEVYTLASIVERETNNRDEKPTIAGVYLNRLRIGMPLQADPTCVFATRDFEARRVTDYHTHFDSPYNTYLYRGLPPGPISMASIPSLDAVLDREQHDYLYFCARPDDSGTHAYAATLSGHNVNVERFREYMRQMKIYN